MAELPRGWTVASLQDVALINPKHPPETSPDAMVSFVPMQAVSELGWKFLRTEERRYSEVRKGYTHFAEGDVLLAKITPCFENGKAAIARELRNDLGCGTTELHVLRPLGGIKPEYLYHYLHQESFRHSAMHKMTGTAGQLRVPLAHIEQVRLPLPPLPEQRRIVAKLEELLGEVDACHKRLEKIPLILKRFRQSVLAAACEGRLTADWRRENPKTEPAESFLAAIQREVLSGRLSAPRSGEPEELGEVPASWTWAPLSQLCLSISDGDHQPPPKATTGVPFATISNMSTGKLELDTKMFVPAAYYKALDDRRRPRKGDVLYSVTGSFGIPALVDTDAKFTFQRHIALLRPHPRVPSTYLLSLLGSRIVRNQATGIATGIAQLTVPLKGLREIRVPVAPPEEQAEIVRRVVNLFKLADQIESRYQAAKASVDQLTQAILAKAFRGELVPQDPKDESASKLLERIQAKDTRPMEAARA